MRRAAKNMGRGMVERHGDRPERTIDQPAFTIRGSAGGTEPGGFVWRDDLVISTGVNSATIGPGAERDALMASGDWRAMHKLQERSIDAPAPTVDTKVGGAWQVHQPGERGHPDAARITLEQAARLQSYPTHIEHGEPMNITALDLFAGHGWGVACQWLGIEERGVELMAEAVATRELNGMSTSYHDVWEGLEGKHATPDHDLLIASPPCQTFSMAGSGAGRKALDEVVGLIESKAYRDVALLREFGESHDPRTALVLTPLAHVYRDLPRYVVLEQVPPVLPVWERMAVEMREWGYSVWVGVLNAEQYGVPQTRRRAVLIAKRDPDIDGEALPPVPTHSRYYSRNPDKLDPGVEKWVSMAEALGWTEPREVVSNYGTGGDPKARGRRSGDEPAAAVTSKADRNVVVRTSMGTPKVDGRNGSHELDSFNRPSHTVTSKFDSATIVEFVSNDKLPHSARRTADQPAPAITGGHDSGNRVWQRPTREVILLDPDKPATTVADSRLSSREHHNHGEQNSTSTKVTLEEAATLQSYPEGFVFAGAKGKQFLQVGNAVPPLLARAVLVAVVS